MSDVKNILLVGVGGQGTILASEILTRGLLSNGYDVKMSEIHGMSQRGGSVSTQVRYGTVVASPTIGKGNADILVSFEEMEAYRWLPFVKKDGIVILNDYRVESSPMLIGKASYPEGLKEEIKSKVNTELIEAAKIAEELGNIKTMNVVILGALIKEMKLESIDWEKIISETVKPRFIEINKKAFKIGLNYKG